MSKKTVLLYNPRRVEKLEREPRGFPIPLLALAGPLLEKGYDVKIFDASMDKGAQEKVLENLDGAICVGFSVWTGFPIADSLELSKKIKKANPNIPIVWGGWHPSILPLQTIKNPNIDIVVRGQGEVTFCDIVQHLEKNSSLKNVLGITYKSGQKIITNPSRSITSLNELPPLPYHLIDVEKYIYDEEGLGERTLGYISSYGCPYNCSFCSDALVWKRRRYDLSAGRLLEDLKRLIENYNIDAIMFWDTNFFVNMNKVKQICEGIIKNKWKLKWGAFERVDHFISLDEETMKIIKNSGCNLLVPGIESGSQKILDLLNKGFKVNDTIKFAKLCQKYDIISRFNFMVGFPNETEEDLNQTLNLIKRIYPLHRGNMLTISFYIPYPGTLLYDKVVKEYGFKSPESLSGWVKYDMNAVKPTSTWVDKRYKRKLRRFLFYLQFAFLNEPFKKSMEKSRFKFLIWPIHKIASFRFKTDFFKLPIEKKIYGMEKIKKMTDKIEGYVTLKERELLYNLARNCTGKGEIVEIGPWKGKSTIWIGKGLRKGKLYAIDPFILDYSWDPNSELYFHKVIKDRKKFGTFFEEFKENIKKAELDDIVITIVNLSELAAKDFNKPVELIFIDGSHDYDYVKRDFELWFPKVVDGGIMAFHDTNRWPGPKKVVEEFVYKSKNFRNARFVDSITFAEKVKQNSVKDRFKNRYFLLLKEVYTFMAKLNLPLLVKKIGKKLLS